ncbi:MAG: FkbM family methyltransferase [Crocosphaera sp.]|nr:FkbM family methyltransferase [Crocosphaera sp.]
MINSLKLKIRRSLGLPEIQERVEHLARQNQELRDLNQVLDAKLKDTLDYNHRIFNQIDQLLDQQKRQFLQELIQQSKSGTILNCSINYCDILAPIELLKLYAHCIDPQPHQKLNFLIETHCVDWLSSHLNRGDTFLDVGASFGTISLPLANILGEKGHIYAFEPAQKTQKFLKQILDINQINNVSVIPSAISDELGTAQFLEYTDTNPLAWASDTSTLNAPTIKPDFQHSSYDVQVTTIDEFVNTYHLQPTAIKIDIEGFEFYALQGGKQTLETMLPYLCIDIHTDVKTGKSALVTVEPFLQSLGYSLTMKEHTLYAIPPEKT